MSRFNCSHPLGGLKLSFVWRAEGGCSSSGGLSDLCGCNLKIVSISLLRSLSTSQKNGEREGHSKLPASENNLSLLECTEGRVKLNQRGVLAKAIGLESLDLVSVVWVVSAPSRMPGERKSSAVKVVHPPSLPPFSLSLSLSISLFLSLSLSIYLSLSLPLSLSCAFCSRD